MNSLTEDWGFYVDIDSDNDSDRDLDIDIENNNLPSHSQLPLIETKNKYILLIVTSTLTYLILSILT
jgi:hypothetical protein